MNTFVKAIKETNKTTTDNDMRAKKSTKNDCVDLFFKAGAMRGQDILPSFETAFKEDSTIALKIAMWLRDVRGGAGERQLFRNILKWLEVNDYDSAQILINKIPLLGRWDDGLHLVTTKGKELYMTLLKNALENGDGLAAKWIPRKGNFAVEFRKFLGYSPKRYRKTLVTLSNTVEQKMCSKQWDDIELEKVPSLAQIRYASAFERNMETKYADYVSSLVKGESKINAGAIYPHNITARLESASSTEESLLEVQWNTLPNYMDDSKILPIVDVSGSMSCTVGGNSSLTCMNVAIALGLYVSDKAKGNFRDVVMTFSESSQLVKLKGKLKQKQKQCYTMDWGMNTNLENAFKNLLKFAKENKVEQNDMPEYILILSDMQFDRCANNPNDSALKMIKTNYQVAGYEIPKIIFWNLNASDNVPVKFDKSGTALISGFSPAIMTAVLSNKLEDFTPMSVMMETLSNPRYEVL